LEELNPHKPNDREYLGSYQKALKAVLANLSEEDLEEAQKLVKLWNGEGAPSEVQLKWVLESFKSSSFKLMASLGRQRRRYLKRLKKNLRIGSFQVEHCFYALGRSGMETKSILFG